MFPHFPLFRLSLFSQRGTSHQFIILRKDAHCFSPLAGFPYKEALPAGSRRHDKERRQRTQLARHGEAALELDDDRRRQQRSNRGQVGYWVGRPLVPKVS